jgi:Carboxypeptidase regulatory-like domain
VVILASLFFGLYLNQISYAFLVLGITVTVSQLYEQPGEFSNSLLLLLRLEETALGAAVAAAVVMLVLPLRTRRVLRIAFRDLVRAVGRLAGHASDRLLGQDHDAGTALRSDARAVDAAYQALMATAPLLRRNLPGGPDEDISQALHLASAARNYSRNLVADTLITPPGRQVARAAADAGGGYCLDAPGPGEYVLLTSAESHLPAASGVTVREPAHGGETVVNVLLAKTSGLAGTVTAAGSGSPAASAAMTLTNAQGTVVDAHADIGLAAGTRLSGLVVTIDGTRPVPGARITLLDETGMVAAAADTDQAGRYVIESLAGGEYTAIISGYPPTASALHITRRAGTVRHDIWLGQPRADHHSIDQQVNQRSGSGWLAT